MIKFPPIDAAAQMWEIFRDWLSNRAWSIVRLIKRWFGGTEMEPPELTATATVQAALRARLAETRDTFDDQRPELIRKMEAIRDMAPTAQIKNEGSLIPFSRGPHDGGYVQLEPVDASDLGLTTCANYGVCGRLVEQNPFNLAFPLCEDCRAELYDDEHSS